MTAEMDQEESVHPKVMGSIPAWGAVFNEAVRNASANDQSNVRRKVFSPSASTVHMNNKMGQT